MRRRVIKGPRNAKHPLWLTAQSLAREPLSPIELVCQRVNRLRHFIYPAPDRRFAETAKSLQIVRTLLTFDFRATSCKDKSHADFCFLEQLDCYPEILAPADV